MMIRMAWRNIWRNKRRSFITLSSIAFAVFFSTLMMSVQKGSLDQMIDNSVKFYTGHLQIQDPKFKDEKSINNSFAYSPDLVDNLSHIDGVEAVSPRIESFA
ncbi:MAG: ABC transporter permease, partial [Cyclobacteriaceae bacterium]|nr:ABC transporter permease [Cyclobacteriaceae bacterium]